jgi:hypothetical protein
VGRVPLLTPVEKVHNIHEAKLSILRRVCLPIISARG